MWQLNLQVWPLKISSHMAKLHNALQQIQKHSLYKQLYVTKIQLNHLILLLRFLHDCLIASLVNFVLPR